jgi:hypothetical protein
LRFSPACDNLWCKQPSKDQSKSADLAQLQPVISANDVPVDIQDDFDEAMPFRHQRLKAAICIFLREPMMPMTI